jgi:hypothetical protein
MFKEGSINERAGINLTLKSYGQGEMVTRPVAYDTL